MRKYFAILMMLALMGCVGPKYYDNLQEISLKLPQNTTFKINKEDENGSKITAKRSFFTLKGTLSKSGFKNKEIELKSHFTTDKWAISTFDTEEDVSAYNLLPPRHTLLFTFGGIVGAATESPHPVVAPIYGTIGGIVGFVSGVSVDVFNLVISIPSVMIYNPWYEYDKEVDLSHVILTPTPEFETKCHSQKNTLIGNNDCLSCSNREPIISTQEECNRCSNREWINGECLLRKK